MKLNDWTQHLEKILLDIASTAQNENKRYYFGGGFSIDLTLGKITRQHEDLDFYPDEKDTQYWKGWFAEREYLVDKGADMDRFPNAFKPRVRKGEKGLVDAYPIHFYENGNIGMLENNGKHGVWEGKNWKNARKVIYKKIPVWIEDPATVIQQKYDTAKKHNIPLKEKHLHDIENFNKFIK